MLLLERHVSENESRPVGRPPAFTGGSKQVKLPEELMHMVAWLSRIEGKTAAQVIVPLVLPRVKMEFMRRYADIKRIKDAEDLAAIASGREPSPPLPTFTTADPITGDEVSAEQAAKSAEALKKKPKK